MFVVRFVIAPSSQELEPPTIPGRFISDLPDGIDAFRGRVPDDCIPIAMTGCDNQILLGISGDRRGKIFYYDLEDEQDAEDTDDPPQCFYPLADSLADFLAMLYEYKDDAK